MIEFSPDREPTIDELKAVLYNAGYRPGKLGRWYKVVGAGDITVTFSFKFEPKHLTMFRRRNQVNNWLRIAKAMYRNVRITTEGKIAFLE